MSELRQIFELWRSACENREEICLATVVEVEGSSYRKPGARMLLTSGGRRAGTISGGCLEAEVQKKAWWLTDSGSTVQRYSSFFDDDSPMPYGMGCGGTIAVLLERGEAAERVLAALEQGARGHSAFVFVSVIDIDAVSASACGIQLILNQAGQAVYESECGTVCRPLAELALRERRSFREQAEGSLFVEYLAPPTALLVVGAGDDAQPVVEFAHRLDWQVTVADGRSHLATAERFPLADRVLALRSFDELPVGGFDAAVILTHSYEQDGAALRALLPVDRTYLGLLGPRRRTERLLGEIAPEIGLTVDECLARLHSPVGLNIGAKSPASIALSITAEIHAVLERRLVRPREVTGQAPVARV